MSWTEPKCSTLHYMVTFFLSSADCCRKRFTRTTVFERLLTFVVCIMFTFICSALTVIQSLHVHVSPGNHTSFQSPATPVLFSGINVFLWCCVFKQRNLMMKSAVRRFNARHGCSRHMGVTTQQRLHFYEFCRTFSGRKHITQLGLHDLHDRLL